jgi:hypothetical protein
LIAGLVQIPDDARLKKWDHVTGYITPFLDAEAACFYTFPAGEGPKSITGIRWLPGLRHAMNDSAYRLESGDWYRVRVQVFPDGRCGFAINGHALLITSKHVRLDRPLVPLFEGNSVQTKLLIRNVVVRASVPSDIDWTTPVWNGAEWIRHSRR